MPQRCDKCGASMAVDQSFCSHCGSERSPRAPAEAGKRSSLPAGSIRAEAAPAHGEARIVFGDQRNLTAGNITRTAQAETSPTDGEARIVFGDQRNLAGGNLTQTYHIQTVAGPAKRLCKICSTVQNEDDCFECQRCKRWVCQTHQDPETLLCLTCAEVLEAKRTRESEGGPLSSTMRLGAAVVQRKPVAPQVISTVATLSVHSHPPGADVLLDSRRVGQTPLSHQLDLGAHRHRQVEAVVRKDGYQSQAAVIQLRRGAVSEWHGVVLSRLATADLPDPTAVHVREILVEPLDVEIEPSVKPCLETPGLPPLAKEIREAAGQLDALCRVIDDLRAENHPSLHQAQAAVGQAHQQCAKLKQQLEETGAAFPGYLRRRLADAAARNPSRAISDLAKLAPRVPGEDLMRFLYTLRHVQHAQRVSDEAQASYQRARDAKIEELQRRAAEVERDLLPTLEDDFAEIIFQLFEQADASSTFPLEAWMKIEPLLAQRAYPWDRRALLAKAETLFQAWPDHRTWREVKQQNTPEAFQEYLAVVPHGLHAAEARHGLVALAQSKKEQDNSDWQTALREGTAAVYQRYLSDHPDGQHAAEARYNLAWEHRRERSRTVSQIFVRAAKALEGRQIVESASLLRRAFEDADNRRYPELWDLWTRTASQGHPRAVEKVYPERVLAGHSGRVCAVRLTVDGERAISAGWDKKLLIWDLCARSCLASLVGHTGGVSCVAVHPDGRRAISGGRDATLRVWDLDAGECLQQLSGHVDTVNGVEISADGHWAASAGCDATVRVWDLETGEARRTLTGHMGEVLDLVIDSADERVLSVGQDGTLRVWDLRDRTGALSLRDSGEAINGVDLSPDGHLAATAGNDGTIRLWELASSQCVAVLTGHRRPVARVRFTVDGTRLLSTGRDRSLRIWDVTSGELLRTLEGHGDQVTDVAAGGGDRWAITSSHDHTLRLWDLDSGHSVAVLGPSPGRPSAVAVPDDERILLAGDDRTIRCVDAVARHVMEDWGGHLAAVACLQVSPDGRKALSLDADQRLRLRDCQSGQSLPPPERCPLPALSAGFAADGQSVFVVCVDGSVHRYHLSGRTWAKVGGPLDARLTCASILAGADLAAGGTKQGQVFLWRPTTSKIVAHVRIGRSPVTDVAFPAGGQRGAAIAGEKLHFADLSNAQVLSAPAGRWRSVAISSDGNWAASGGADGVLAVWDARNADCLASSQAHTGSVPAVAFSPSGSLLVSGGADARLCTWRLMWDLEQ